MNKEDIEKMMELCISCGVTSDCKVFQKLYIEYMKALLCKLDELSNRLNSL